MTAVAGGLGSRAGPPAGLGLAVDCATGGVAPEVARSLAAARRPCGSRWYRITAKKHTVAILRKMLGTA
ncbi:MAG: hypothetical protein ACYC61_02900 [Isosphaeraceae bacterium]